MENAGEMEEHGAEKEDGIKYDQKNSKPAFGVLENGHKKDASYNKKRKGQKSVLIKQEERETGVVSWGILMR